MSSANSAYANISGLMLLENRRQISTKVVAFDVCVFIGPAETNKLMGSVRYFNNDDESTGEFEAGFYNCQIRVVKMEPGFEVQGTNNAEYDFAGDLKAFSGPVDAIKPYRVYVHILGMVTKSVQDKGKEAFEMEAQQYTLAHADAKKDAENKAQQNGISVSAAVAAVPRSIFQVTGFFGDSQRYKNKKPVPFPNKMVLVGGFLTGMTEELQDATVKKRFLVEVDEVTFINTVQAAPKAAPPITPSASGSGSNRFSSYTKKRPRTDDDAAPTSSPSPAS
ncbi:hypothetical protein C8R45DRAFT_928810 [Mycena sanguinolenta]|nr:hypothetical protein C8R45DRAFT_928810 [Mycena sanguinolenta]